MIEAVLFDLDDTLYPQWDWLEGALACVADAAAAWSVCSTTLFESLVTVAREGSARGGIIDRALALVGAQIPVPPLVQAFRSYSAPSLSMYEGAREGLARLRSRVALGLVTDGDEGVQRSKLASLGLEATFDVFVVSDALGPSLRKPHRAPFDAALSQLDVPAGRAVFVGDHPYKDVAGAEAAGMRAVRVLTGEYTHLVPARPPWLTRDTVADACACLLRALDPSASVR